MATFAYYSSRLILVLSLLSIHAISTAATFLPGTALHPVFTTPTVAMGTGLNPVFTTPTVAMGKALNPVPTTPTAAMGTALNPVPTTPTVPMGTVPTIPTFAMGNALNPVPTTPTFEMGKALNPVPTTPTFEMGKALNPVPTTPSVAMGTALNPVPTKSVENDMVLTWCGKTDQRGQCETVVKRDQREDLKATPEGIVTILLDAAQQCVGHTTEFIQHTEKDLTDKEVAKAFNTCAGACDTIGNGLKLTPTQMSDSAARVGAADALNKLECDVSNRCEGFKPNPMPPPLQKMFEKMDDFVHIVQIATQILKHM